MGGVEGWYLLSVRMNRQECLFYFERAGKGGWGPSPPVLSPRTRAGREFHEFSALRSALVKTDEDFQNITILLSGGFGESEAVDSRSR